MNKHMITKLAAALCLPVTIAITNGCGTSVVAPENGKEQVVKTAPTSGQPPVILPIDPTYAPRRTDLTGDGWVDASDLAAFAAILAADLNGDRAVDGADLILLGAVLSGTPVDRNGDGFVDASDLAASVHAQAHADLNHSGRVDASDLAAFAAMRGKGDLNGDGSANIADLTVIRKHLGQQIEPAV